MTQLQRIESECYCSAVVSCGCYERGFTDGNDQGFSEGFADSEARCESHVDTEVSLPCDTSEAVLWFNSRLQTAGFNTLEPMSITWDAALRGFWIKQGNLEALVR